MRFAYADPPYPGQARKRYGREPEYEGEVDHPELLRVLEGFPDGWGLSTGAYALRQLLPLCPEGVRVCAWVKPLHPCPETYGLHNTWEPLLIYRGRQERPGRRDWFEAGPARLGVGRRLEGRKPLAFCAFLFRALGMRPGDELADLFPGSGAVGRAWAEVERRASLGAGADASPRAARDGKASPRTSPDASPSPAADRDASPATSGDTSPSCRGDA
jgi:hypothetical protein